MSLSNFLLAYFIAQFFKILSIIEPDCDSKIPDAYKKGAQHSRNSRSQQESCIARKIHILFPSHQSNKRKMNKNKIIPDKLGAIMRDLEKKD